MPGHDDRGFQFDQPRQCGDPSLAVGLADIGNAAAKNQVTSEQNLGPFCIHHQVLGRVRWSDMADEQTVLAHLQHRVAIQPAVGGHQPRVLVDPREELFPAGLQSQPRCL